MSVSKRGDGRSPFYQYEFEIAGRRFRGSTGCKVEREALAVERQKRVEAEQQIALERLDPSRTTVEQVFARYWMTHGHALSWAVTVKKHMIGLEAALGGGKPFRDVSTADISAALDEYAQTDGRKNRGGSVRPGRPSPSTVNRRLSVFRSIHNKARREWKLPVQDIDFPVLERDEPKVRVRHITREQARDVLDRLPQHIVLIVAWSLATGCRKNETRTLRWSRINLETRQAEVLTKGGGTRFVDLGDSALQVLAECKRTDDTVFSFKNLRRHFDRALREAGIEDFRFHDLRHTFATWLGNAIGDIAVVMKALGHGQITTTMRYRHVMRTDVARGVQQLPALLAGKVVPLNNRLVRRMRRVR